MDKATKTDKAAMKAAILAAISEEVDLWLDKEGGIKDGYEYEDELLKTARNMGCALLKGSLGAVPKDRNGKKNSTPASGGLRSASGTPCAVTPGSSGSAPSSRS
jgi:hypothetical protein